MNKEETTFIAESLIDLNSLIDVIELLHKSLTEFILQKGEPNVESPNNSNRGGN